MRTKMPDVIDAYIQASNSRDADRFGSLFSEDAIVHDEGQECITAEIRAPSRSRSVTSGPACPSRDRPHWRSQLPFR
jgi:hypothetical protein